MVDPTSEKKGILLSGAGMWLCPVCLLHPPLRPHKEDLWGKWGRRAGRDKDDTASHYCSRVFKSGAHKSYAAEPHLQGQVKEDVPT